MPIFPQYQNATLVESANYRQLTQGTHVSHTSNPLAACSAASGDIITNVVAAGDATAYTVTLPSVALGGPVCVKVTGAYGNVSNTVTVIPQVVDTVAGCLIDGFGSVTLVQPGESAVFGSDGTNWWMVSKSHNTTATW